MRKTWSSVVEILLSTLLVAISGFIVILWEQIAFYPLPEIFSNFGGRERFLVWCSDKQLTDLKSCPVHMLESKGPLTFKPIVESQVVVMQFLPDDAPFTEKDCAVRSENDWNCPSSGISSVDGKIFINVKGLELWRPVRYRLCIELRKAEYCTADESWVNE